MDVWSLLLMESNAGLLLPRNCSQLQPIKGCTLVLAHSVSTALHKTQHYSLTYLILIKALGGVLSLKSTPLWRHRHPEAGNGPRSSGLSVTELAWPWWLLPPTGLFSPCSDLNSRYFHMSHTKASCLQDMWPLHAS